MVKPRWPVLAALLLLAALLAALPGAASAQTPEWTESSDGTYFELALTVPGAIFEIDDGSGTVGDRRCARWTTSTAPSIELMVYTARIYAVCAYRDAYVRSHGPNSNLEYDEVLKKYIELHLLPTVDQDRINDWPDLEIELSPGPDDDSFGSSLTDSNIFDTPAQETQALVAVETTTNHDCSQCVVPSRVSTLGPVGDTLEVTLRVETSWLTDGTEAPETPPLFNVSRNPDYSEATLTWEYFEPVSEYQVERLEALTVSAGDVQRFEYGNLMQFSIDGTIHGVNSYVDDTVNPQATYKYRVRAQRNPDIDEPWSDWTAYVASGEKPSLDLDAPANVELSRTQDNSETTVSWTAPEGDFDNYTLQRQELVIVEGSTIFANAVTLGGAGWLPGNATTYTDDSFLPGRTYEYRAAAVKDGLIGDYSDWSRSSPVQTSLGVAPENFRFVSGNGSRLLDRRREFWMRWDEVDGADDYEVDVLVFDVATGRQTIENYIVTDPTYFRTSYGRVEVRVRGRKSDDTLCGDSDGTVETGENCYSEWTGWYGVNFTPKVAVAVPPLVDDTADASIMELRADTKEVIESSLAAAGAPVDAGLVVQFLTLVAATVIGGISVALGWRLGMAPLGVGMGAAIAILILFTGYRLFGVPLAWPVSIQAALAVAGLFAAVRQTGVFR